MFFCIPVACLQPQPAIFKVFITRSHLGKFFDCSPVSSPAPHIWLIYGYTHQRPTYNTTALQNFCFPGLLRRPFLRQRVSGHFGFFTMSVPLATPTCLFSVVGLWTHPFVHHHSLILVFCSTLSISPFTLAVFPVLTYFSIHQ